MAPVRLPPLPRQIRLRIAPAAAAALCAFGCQAPAPTAPTTSSARPAPPAQVATTTPPPAPSAPVNIPSARRPVEAREPKLTATTQIEPCVFRGSLLASAALYAQPAGGKPIASLHGGSVVEIERLELPSARGGRARVIVRFPVHVEAYLEEGANVLQLDRRVDLVPGRVWLDPGVSVHGASPSGGAAEIVAQFPDGASPPQFVTRLSCSDLSLPREPRLSWSAPERNRVRLGPGRISIHESAGGREIAAIPGHSGPTALSSVRLIEKRPAWLRVEGDFGFHFDGWVPASSLAPDQKPQFGLVGLLAPSRGVTHQATRPIPLRAEASDAAPVIARAAEGAEIAIQPGPPGYRLIRFGIGVSGPPQDGPLLLHLDRAPFFAREADLGGAVRLADGVEPGEPEEAPASQGSAKATTGGRAESPRAEAPPAAELPPMFPPSVDQSWDLADSPGHASLEDGARRARAGDWAGARRALSAAITGLQEGDIEARIAGHALLGRACDRAGDARCAAEAFAKVRDLAKGVEATLKGLVASREDAAMKRALRVLLAQGEALFYAAEQKRKAADAIRFPTYRGSGSREDVLAHINTAVTDWVKKKRLAIQEADLAYFEILKLKPAAPPRWVVVAGARVGDMWSAFVHDFRTGTPVPTEWTKKGNVPGTDVAYEELLKEYTDRLDEASEPQRKNALAAYQACRDTAKRYGLASEEGKRCEGRLAALGAAR